MSRAYIRIGDGALEDSRKRWGFVYKDADPRMGGDVKEFAASSYIEEAGEHTDPRTVEAAFDWGVRFVVTGTNRNSVNSVNGRIAAFNRALYDTDESGVRHYKRVTVVDESHRVSVTGIARPIGGISGFYRSRQRGGLDVAEIEFRLRVDRPELCDWNVAPETEVFYESDLGVGGYGLNTTNNGVYKGTWVYMREIEVRVDAGDKVTLTTVGRGVARPWFLTDYDYKMKRQSDEMSVDGAVLLIESPGLLLVSFDPSMGVDFNLVIEHGAAMADVSSSMMMSDMTGGMPPEE